MGAIADMAIEIYAMESAVLRAQKLTHLSSIGRRHDPGLPFARNGESRSRRTKILWPHTAEGDNLRTQLAILRRLAKHEPYNTIVLRQQIAQKSSTVANIASAKKP